MNKKYHVGILLAHKAMNLGGAWYSYTRPNGEEVRGQGMPAFRTLVDANPDIYAEMEAATLKALSTSEHGRIIEEFEEDPEDQPLDEMLTDLAGGDDAEDEINTDEVLDG